MDITTSTNYSHMHVSPQDFRRSVEETPLRGASFFRSVRSVHPSDVEPTWENVPDFFHHQPPQPQVTKDDLWSVIVLEDKDFRHPVELEDEEEQHRLSQIEDAEEQYRLSQPVPDPERDSFPVPPVPTTEWNDQDWLNWIKNPV